jgi:hypothetical protein
MTDIAQTDHLDDSEEVAPSLELQDMKHSLQIIDHLVGEGALKGWSNIEQVQRHRRRLLDFIEYVEAQQAAEAATTVAGDETPEA